MKVTDQRLLGNGNDDSDAIPDKLLKIQNGKCLFIGKILTPHRVIGRFTWGEIWIARLRDDRVEDASSASVVNEEGDDQMIISFQNENLNLAAYVEKHDGSKSMVAIVPLCWIPRVTPI
ncbi:hypothetical protein K435DRAFT_798937 [Dendrothele bispora CBS 962.96]|uniref:S-Me-THD-like C-terminal domain-containing protein n=1 Tax=Dendrothele bispora (strain CBS 962.96) TaxID=1314807 RepID=A0A4S8LXM9_DENBC|nr:hypothetical protein K435DRAFT_798937 [Dendrothele bispora CBS 962.96]